MHTGFKFFLIETYISFTIPLSVKSLTAREHDVLKLICDGCSNREIGVALQIAETTARDHVHSVIHKLNARNRTACAVKSIRLQVVS